ncbi:hypothetical protein QEG73_00320 [Chitinophagaceae bacterium 26-R-25]|nr:hypothetical protein [Chitinophagaceae bacterium 26-R-25]
MENEVMITVLNEVLSEQKEANQKMGELAENVSLLSVLNNKLSNKVENLQTDLTRVNSPSTEALINRKAEEIKRMIIEQPKEIIQEKRYLLFPEHNAKDYFEVCMKWFLYLMIATYAFFLLLYLIQCVTVR